MGGWDEAPEYGGGGGGKWATVLGGIAAVLSSALVAWFYFASAAAQTTTVAGVASVVDGDTIEIHGQRVRLSGIDAPESGKRCGTVNVYQRASLALSNFIGSRTVSCAVSDHDRHGRAVARCSVGGTDLGDHMVEQGWARDWPRYSGGEYADEEARARIDHRGIWGMQCPADLWGSRDYSAGAGSVLPAAAAGHPPQQPRRSPMCQRRR